MLSQHDGRPEPQVAKANTRTCQCSGPVPARRVAGADAVFELQQVGDLSTQLSKVAADSSHPIAGAEIVEGDDRSGRVMS